MSCRRLLRINRFCSTMYLINNIVPKYNLLFISIFGIQQQLTHPHVMSPTLRFKKWLFSRVLHLEIQISLYPASLLFGFQQQLTHPPVIVQPFLSGRCPLFRTLHLGIQFQLHSVSVSYLFGTQQQLTHPPVKSTTLLQENAHFSFFILRHLFGTQQQPTHPLVKSLSLPLWKNHVSPDLWLCNLIILPCLVSLWFGSHPYYSLNLYVHLYNMWFISIAKDRRCPKYFKQRKTTALQRSVARDSGGISEIRLQFFLVKASESSIIVYQMKVSDCAPSTVLLFQLYCLMIP